MPYLGFNDHRAPSCPVCGCCSGWATSNECDNLELYSDDEDCQILEK